LNCGDLVAMVMDSALATAVITIKVLVVDTTILKLLVLTQVGHTLSVLELLILAALENVKDVTDAHHMSMDVI
tara:strand:+ start:270 stop:488 length:219 start_codon:yes stop_codon:yes gene_type:complete